MEHELDKKIRQYSDRHTDESSGEMSWRSKHDAWMVMLHTNETGELHEELWNKKKNKLDISTSERREMSMDVGNLWRKGEVSNIWQGRVWLGGKLKVTWDPWVIGWMNCDGWLRA